MAVLPVTQPGVAVLPSRWGRNKNLGSNTRHAPPIAAIPFGRQVPQRPRVPNGGAEPTLRAVEKPEKERLL